MQLYNKGAFDIGQMRCNYTIRVRWEGIKVVLIQIGVQILSAVFGYFVDVNFFFM